MRRFLLWLAVWAHASASPGADSFRFAVLGDRTGEAEPGVYEQVWREIAAEKPAFVLSVGDTIQGLDNAAAEAQWREFERIRARFRRLPLYLTAGNHDIWSEASQLLYVRHAGRGVHYSFDYRQAHFTILDNSRADGLAPGEMAFLEADLQEHAAQTVKVIVSHRPSWLIPAMLRDSHFALHELARKYGVRYVIAGHVHEMMHFELDGVTYISALSSGGHLRASKRYEDGWLFGHMLAQVNGNQVTFQIREAGAPHGERRVSALVGWGAAGLIGR
jgi:Icc protein